MSLAYGYPAEWVYASNRGYWAGRVGDMYPLDHAWYKALPPFSPEAMLFRHWFDKGRSKQRERVAAGREQRPGSVYDPKLDDHSGNLKEVE